MPLTTLRPGGYPRSWHTCSTPAGARHREESQSDGAGWLMPDQHTDLRRAMNLAQTFKGLAPSSFMGTSVCPAEFERGLKLKHPADDDLHFDSARHDDF